jgi:hypothetical protein
MRNFTIGMLMAFLLTSCGPRIGSNFWFDFADQSERVAYYKKVCISYGYDEGDEGLKECIAKEIRDKRIASKKGMDNISNSLDNLGSSGGKRVTCQTYGTITNCREY